MPEPLLRAEGLSRKDGGATELASVSFSVEAGRLTAVIGPDRWDKDALMAVLTGRQRPTHGTLRLAGRPITGLAPRERPRRGLVWTTRPPVAFATGTLVEAVVLAMAAVRRARPGDVFRRHPSAPSAADAVELLQLVGLGARSGATPDTLDGLERARLELARMLAPAPKVVIVDRLGLDLPPPARRPLAMLLRHLVQSGVTLLWLEEDATLALEFADHVVALQHGRTLVPGVVGTPSSEAALEAAFMGEPR